MIFPYIGYLDKITDNPTPPVGLHAGADQTANPIIFSIKRLLRTSQPQMFIICFTQSVKGSRPSGLTIPLTD